MSSSATQILLASPTTKLISQGAEAKVYRAYLLSSGLNLDDSTGPGSQKEPISESLSEATTSISKSSDVHVPVLLKFRFPKRYRHPALDVPLTRARVAGEARAIIKCLRSGVNVPGIRMVDAVEGVLGLEWIEGSSVRRLLPGGAEDEEEGVDEEDNDEDPLKVYKISTDVLMELIGTEIAKMHLADVIHGDLTTSNMMVRHPSSFKSSDPGISTQLVLIDFGLSYHSSLVEDKAVDLYVLERAFSSTHPDSEPMFASVLKTYGKQMGKQWSLIGRRLDDVRLRGRKRSMVG